VAFHPHGIFFHQPSSMLYTVNHAYMKGGERIEVFKVTVGADNKVRRDRKAPVRLEIEHLQIHNDEVMPSHHRPYQCPPPRYIRP
jgi:hypothetical protein